VINSEGGIIGGGDDRSGTAEWGIGGGRFEDGDLTEVIVDVDLIGRPGPRRGGCTAGGGSG
jgi:hypothetical protein